MHQFRDSNARDKLKAKVSALRRPRAYPEPVRDIEAIETHMAWVFLTDDHAYKLKKPVRSQFFDHTTIESRKQACETEQALNRRLAEDVYLAIVPLVKSGSDIQIDDDGATIDWLVKMRRLPRNRMLDTLIDNDDVKRPDIDRLAMRLSEFYEQTDPAQMSNAEYRQRICADIASKTESISQPQYGLQSSKIEAAVDRLRSWLKTHDKTLDHRAGTIVDAHGDLRPEHICLEPEPVVIDCLEFDRSLRLLDPLSELAFLTLECHRLGNTWIGERLITRYVEQTGDLAPTTLITFYQAYHALVRAAVALWHIDDEVLNQTDKWRRRGSWYLQYIRHLL